VAELPRQSRRLRGEPPKFSPSQLEGLQALVTPSESRVGSPEEGESSLVVHPDYQALVADYSSQPISFSEVTSSFSSTSELAEEPKISEPETEPPTTPTSGLASPTSSGPGSPRVERVITQNLPSGLIAIDELVTPKVEGISIPENQPVIELRECKSIFCSPPRSDAWYLSLTNFLENPGLSFSPPRIPFHPTPRGYYPPLNMSRQSSMFSQSPETFLHGGPSVPFRCQALAGTFSGASPQPSQQGLLIGNNGTKPLSVEDILMMSGTIPNPQPQGSQLPPKGQPQGPQISPGGQPQDTQLPPGGQPQGQYIPMGQYIPQGQPQTQYQYVPQGQPQYQYVPQGYQPQGHYPTQDFQPPSGQSFVQGTENVPLNYQSYPQPGYGPQYTQPAMGPYPKMNLVWNSSQSQPVLQPNVQLSSQTGQPLVSGSIQQPIQSTIQTFASSVVSQPGPSTPRTLPQMTAATAATFVPSTPPTSGVSTAPVSIVPVSIPQVSFPQSGPTIQTSVQMLVGQPGPSTVVTSQPQFTYQPYQGQYQYGPAVQQPIYQYQPYPGYTYQQTQQPQYGLVNPGFPRRYNIPNAIPIPSYPRYPPLRAGLMTQGFRDPNCQLPFIATLDLPDLSRLTNDLINYLPFWPPMPNKLPSDISKFEGKPGEAPSNHVMTYHLWCASNSISDDSIRFRIFQHSLIGLAAKWYIELLRATFYNFS